MLTKLTSAIHYQKMQCIKKHAIEHNSNNFTVNLTLICWGPVQQDSKDSLQVRFKRLNSSQDHMRMDITHAHERENICKRITFIIFVLITGDKSI